MLYEVIYKEIEPNKEYEEIVKKIIKECFDEEKILETGLYITVILTNSEQIQKANKQYRKINKATDVLSFPMFEKDELEEKINKKIFIEEEVLGDIIISIDKIKEQAKEYKHSFERELSYMLVHGFYHLFGYDHIKEEDKIKMRLKEEKILATLKIERE